MDETIELYDGPMLDDELAAIHDNSNAGTILLVMDSCFSGGFSKDIVSQPGRMGLFSSEEDVTSQVAFKFQAGGYLSVFFDEAIREGYADRDDNGEVTAIELSQYLHGRETPKKLRLAGRRRPSIVAKGRRDLRRGLVVGLG